MYMLDDFERQVNAVFVFVCVEGEMCLPQSPDNSSPIVFPKSTALQDASVILKLIYFFSPLSPFTPLNLPVFALVWRFFQQKTTQVIYKCRKSLTQTYWAE